jgi:hypothetical protein
LSTARSTRRCHVQVQSAAAVVDRREQSTMHIMS